MDCPEVLETLRKKCDDEASRCSLLAKMQAGMVKRTYFQGAEAAYTEMADHIKRLLDEQE